MLELQNVSKVYGRGDARITAVEDVTLTIRRGEFVSIVGPSGSGKSTLLFMMGGLLKPSSGKVLIDGTSFYDVGGAARTALRLKYCGFIFQTFHLIPYLTALENVEVPLMTTGMNSKSQHDIAMEALRRVGLEERAYQRANKLSVGEMQRVALARALVNKPSLILADEPTANLDEETAASVVEYLKTFRNEGVAIVMVTHDVELGNMADRRIRLRKGRVVDVEED